MDYTIHGILQARILEWVAFLFSRGSSQLSDRIQVSCIAGRFFTNWATREAHFCKESHKSLTWCDTWIAPDVPVGKQGIAATTYYVTKS